MLAPFDSRPGNRRARPGSLQHALTAAGVLTLLGLTTAALGRPVTVHPLAGLIVTTLTLLLVVLVIRRSRRTPARRRLLTRVPACAAVTLVIALLPPSYPGVALGVLLMGCAAFWLVEAVMRPVSVEARAVAARR